MMIKNILCFILIMATSHFAIAQTKFHKADFYISPTGNDHNNGSYLKPFATLQKARRAVRILRNKLPGTNIKVYIRGGKYRLNETVVFGLLDGTVTKATTSYEAYPGENPVFSGAVELKDWHKLGTDTIGFASKASGKIWYAKIPASFKGKNFYTLYNSNGLMTRATSEGLLPTNETDLFGNVPFDQHEISFPQGKIKNWKYLSNVEIVTRTCAAWELNILNLDSINEKKGIAYTRQRATYNLGQCGYRPLIKELFWIENAAEYLNEPGEWMADNKNGIIYYWPLNGKPENDIELPILTELVKVEGKIDYNSSTDIPVKNIIFKGLTFTHGQRYKREADRVGWGLQHDWELFDYPSAAVRLRGAENCSIDSCQFINNGSTGIRLDLYCQKNAVINNTIQNVGAVGILLAGYGPGTKDVNKNNLIINNNIHHCGLIYWASSAIFLWQSGENTVRNNLIHHTPYSGIVISGRIMWGNNPVYNECNKTIRRGEIPEIVAIENGFTEISRSSWDLREKYLHGRNNRIEFNELHHTMLRLNDGNDIYISGTGRNNRVADNYIHDSYTLGSDAAIRCDNDQHETVIENNTIFHTRGAGVIIKGTNTIQNNFFIDILPAGHTYGYIFIQENDVNGSIIKHNIFYSRTKGQTPIFVTPWTHPEPDISKCVVDSNIYYCQPDTTWAKSHMIKFRTQMQELHSLEVDPEFIDINNNNFNLKQNSKAILLGIKNIDTSKAGLLKLSYHHR